MRARLSFALLLSAFFSLFASSGGTIHPDALTCLHVGGQSLKFWPATLPPYVQFQLDVDGSWQFTPLLHEIINPKEVWASSGYQISCMCAFPRVPLPNSEFDCTAISRFAMIEQESIEWNDGQWPPLLYWFSWGMSHRHHSADACVDALFAIHRQNASFPFGSVQASSQFQSQCVQLCTSGLGGTLLVALPGVGWQPPFLVCSLPKLTPVNRPHCLVDLVTLCFGVDHRTNEQLVQGLLRNPFPSRDHEW